MKQKLLLVILMVLPIMASAQYEIIKNVEIDDLYYNLRPEDKIAIVVSNPYKRYSGDIVIPESVTYEGTEYTVTDFGPAFYQCTDLTSVVIPATVTCIGYETFLGCTKLTSVNLPSGLKGIADHAFWGCTNLRSLTLPESMTYIGSWAFFDCNSLTFTSVAIPDGMNILFEGAYEGCSSMTSIIIPECVTKIENEVFAHCSSLTSVTIPDNVTHIGKSAFYKCSGLTTLTIGSGIETIRDIAFGTCPALTDVYCYAESVPTTAVDAFRDSNPENVTLHVPVGCMEAYKASEPWSQFKQIVEFSSETISIGSSGKTTLTSSKALDLRGVEDLKAYVATGYESNGTIWLTRIKEVPAGTPILIKGTAGKEYKVPVMDKCDAYFENMFQGSATQDLIISGKTEDRKYMNFYMSNGQFKPASASQKIGAGKAYLQVPAKFKDATAGEDQIVKIADSGKSSYAPPVDVDLTDVDGLKAYAATGYDAANSTIWLTRINKIQAGEGVLLKGEAGKEYTLPSAEVQAYYGNMFVGNIDEKITINETSDDGAWTNYYLASGSFKKVSGTREIGTNKSYLHLPTSLLVSSARGKQNAGTDEWFMEELETETILLGSIGGDDDGTTRINAISNDSAQPDVYYNLQGQRVNNPKKGLYILNGKKVVIK